MLGFAEFERDMIVQRTQEGKEIARTKGVRVDGRPKKEISIEESRRLLKLQRDRKISVNQCCAELGISRSYWYKEIAKQSI